MTKRSKEAHGVQGCWKLRRFEPERLCSRTGQAFNSSGLQPTSHGPDLFKEGQCLAGLRPRAIRWVISFINGKVEPTYCSQKSECSFVQPLKIETSRQSRLSMTLPIKTKQIPVAYVEETKTQKEFKFPATVWLGRNGSASPFYLDARKWQSEDNKASLGTKQVFSDYSWFIAQPADLDPGGHLSSSCSALQQQNQKAWSAKFWCRSTYFSDEGAALNWTCNIILHLSVTRCLSGNKPFT